ncbi:CbiQ family ECF transporter T component [Desulfovirgula thermocuniculi]|uniref:CbiQ family ECF transporter T component n=1 Tax=Desulfovirgula thermocuniculi TaxID=348842 RepID=UPI000683E41B|nr:CbiQ family ECF transporter T component [Desulfovirgula thermocuniculi]
MSWPGRPPWPLTWGAGGEVSALRFSVLGLAVGTSYADLYRAGLILVKSLGATSCLYFLALTTPVIEVACFLRKARLPALWVELFCLTYRFIFVIMETAEKIYLSQSARWGYASLQNSYRSLGQLVSVLLVRSLYRSRALYTALLARGYDGELQVLEERFEVSGKNWAFITGTGAVLLFLALAGRGWPF